MAGRGWKLDRFFRRRPGLYFAIRLLVFGGGFSLVIWYCIDTGRIPYRHHGGLLYAKNPIQFSAMIALMVAGTTIAVAASTLVFLRQKRVLSPDWRPFGIDFRR